MRPGPGLSTAAGPSQTGHALPGATTTRGAAGCPLPPPLRKSNTKVPEFDGDNTLCGSDKGVGCMHREKPQAMTIAS